MKTARMGSLVVAATSALVLVGCTGEPSPIVTETPVPTLSPSVEVSPSVEPSQGGPLSNEELLAILPPGADRDDVQGAVVTAHFFVQEFPKLFVTGDFAVWDAVSSEGCEYCASARDGAQGYLDDGWVVRRGDTAIVEGTTEAIPQDDGTVLVAFHAIEDEVFVTEPGESERMALGRVEYQFLVLMSRQESAWSVVDVHTEPA
jgi:hypothetical protein